MDKKEYDGYTINPEIEDCDNIFNKLANKELFKAFELGKQAGFNKGKSIAITDVMKIIDKLEVKPKDNSITRFSPYIYTEQLRVELNKPQ